MYPLSTVHTPAVLYHMPVTPNDMSLAVWRDGREEERTKNIPLSRSSYTSNACDNLSLMSTQVEPTLPIFKPQEGFQPTISAGDQMFIHELKSVAKEASEHGKAGNSPSLSRTRLEGSNSNDVNLESSASETPSPRIHPRRTSAEAGLDHICEERHREMSEDAMSIMNDPDASAGGDQQNAALDPGSEKKKGKRSRLTANQTRFLMSEFARQPHPDAAHRERLSREIPGFSPRQVQVWFQNRRAKLKRLTSRDRERMLKSRALPDDFDMTRVLHHPFSTRSEMSFRSPRSHPVSYGAGGMPKPLIVNGIKREGEEDYVISPASTTSYGNYTPSPTSCPPSDNLSSTATPTNPAALSNSKPTLHSANHSSVNPLSRSHSLSAGHPHGWQSISGIQAHDQNERSRADSLGTRHQTSMSYPRNTYHDALPRSSDGMVFNYDNLPLLQDPIQPTEAETPSATFATTYQKADSQLQGVRTMPYSHVQPVQDNSRVGVQMATYYREMPALQTALPVMQGCQVPPFNHLANFDSVSPYTPGHASVLSLPASPFRSEASAESPSQPVDDGLYKSASVAAMRR